MTRYLYLALLVSACRNDVPSKSCYDVGDNVASVRKWDAPGADNATGVGISQKHMFLSNACQTDDWGASARFCFATAETVADIEGCKSKLTAQQRPGFELASSQR